MSVTDVKSFTVEYEISIAAPREVVFDAMTSGIHEWFPHRVKAGSPITWERAIGGRSMEEWGEGQGALFAVNTVLKRPSVYSFTYPGGVFGHYVSMTTYRFEEENDGTRVKISMYGMGDVSEEASEMFSKGFPPLMQDLAKYCENR